MIAVQTSCRRTERSTACTATAARNQKSGLDTRILSSCPRQRRHQHRCLPHARRIQQPLTARCRHLRAVCGGISMPIRACSHGQQSRSKARAMRLDLWALAFSPTSQAQVIRRRGPRGQIPPPLNHGPPTPPARSCRLPMPPARCRLPMPPARCRRTTPPARCCGLPMPSARSWRPPSPCQRIRIL